MSKVQLNRRYSLKDSRFFRLRSRKKLACLLQSSTMALNEIIDGERRYRRCWKHKVIKDDWLFVEPTGNIALDYRPIDIPDPKLKVLQSRIADLLSRIEPPQFLFSPVRGKSYVDNAARHKDSTSFWMLDIANYFPSCTSNNVFRFFHSDLECSPDVARILTNLTTENDCLPQGSPCSPILAYFSNLPMWLEINNVVSKVGYVLSVYADDITISGAIVRKEIIWAVKKVVHNHGHKLKAKKEYSLINSPAEITGVIVVNGKTKLPNRQRKRLVDLKSEYSNASQPKNKAKIFQQIAGREAQRRQVESPQSADGTSALAL